MLRIQYLIIYYILYSTPVRRKEFLFLSCTLLFIGSAGCSESLLRRLSSARPPSGNPGYSQAGASVYPDPGVRAPAPVVVYKTKGQGLRQEITASRRIRSSAETWELDDVINRGAGNMVWDVPRSARHEVRNIPMSGLA